MTRTVALLLTLAALSVAPHGAQTQEQTVGEQPPDVLWHEAKALLPTRMFCPPDFDQNREHTLVVGFHGYGASASSFGKTARVLAEMGFVVALPESAYPLLANGKLGFQWFPSTKDDEDSQRAAHLLFSENTPAILDDLKARYAIDKVYALGFSEGAVAALGTAIFNHEDFAGSVQFGLPLFSADWITAQELSAGKSVRLLFVHGREDDRAPLAVSEEARSYFRDADYESALEVFDGGHTVPQDQLKVAAEWMSREERGTPDVR